MLQKLREKSGHWLFKILLGLIAICFGMWGMTDMIMNYSRSTPAIKVMGQTVSQEEFFHIYDEAIKNYQRRRNVKMDASIRTEIRDLVQEQLIEKAIIAAKVHAHDFAVTDEYVSRVIKMERLFLNENGQFDKQRFQQALKNNGMTEAGLIRNTREQLVMDQLRRVFTIGAQLPTYYTQALFNGQNQQRIFAVVHVPLGQMTVKEIPTTEELKALYSANEKQFMRPETRSVSLLIAHSAKIKEQVVISPDELEAEYMSRQSEFIVDGVQKTLLEVRSQLIESLQTRKSADFIAQLRNNMEDGVAGGGTIDDLAKELKIDAQHYKQVTLQGIDLETHQKLPDATRTLILETLKDLAPQTGSQVLDLPDGSMMIVYLSGVNPPSLPAFENCEDEVRAFWMQSHQQEAAGKIANQLSQAKDPEFLEQEAEKLGLGLKILPPISYAQVEGNFRVAQELPYDVWHQAFTLKKNGALKAFVGNGFMVVMLVDALTLDKTQWQKQEDEFTQTMKQLYTSDVFKGYIHNTRKLLMKQEKIDINKSFLSQIEASS